MPDQSSTSVSVHCRECRRQMESPIACESCGALSADPPESFDCFELFGMRRHFDIDQRALHQKYLTLSRLVHPDIAGAESDEARSYSLALSAKLNRAYETLRHPRKRAEYLLTLSGGPTAAENKNVPGGLLADVMFLREEIEEAKADNDIETLQRIGGDVRRRHDESLDRITALCRRLPEQDPQRLNTLREELNGIKYWENLLDKLPDDDG